MIIPAGLQAPIGTPAVAGHSVCAGPPATSIFISRARLLPAKARERPSGDQNTGALTPSVPGSACASDEFIGLSQICERPSPSMAAKASVRPSGEMAGAAAVKLVLSGGHGESGYFEF